MQNNSEDILKHHNLRLTDNRKQILDVFLSHPVAHSHSAIEEKLPHFDRVTIYRTLNAFEENGILHKVLDDGMSAKFALCHTCEIHHEAHAHEHVHFKCEKCNETICLDHVSIPSFQIPNGYLVKNVGLLVQGICKKCQ
jgi:Fur family transcriptional regulator, ferric uptake regulator